MLHGPKGFWQDVSEDVYTGNFVDGELYGKGVYLGKKGDSYHGKILNFLFRSIFEKIIIYRRILG